MYGLIGKIDCASGKREALASILLEATTGMPGCRSYVVALDVDDEDALWITEVWDNQESHAASLTSPAIQEAIREGRPMILGFSSRTETAPLGGFGLA